MVMKRPSLKKVKVPREVLVHPGEKQLRLFIFYHATHVGANSTKPLIDDHSDFFGNEFWPF